MQMHLWSRRVFIFAITLAAGGLAYAADKKTEKPNDPPKTARVVIEDMVAHIEEQLGSKTEVAYLDTQLSDVVNDLELRHRVSIGIDKEALQSDGKGPETTVSLHIRDISMAAVLNRLLKPQGLTWIVADEGILITTPAGEIKHLITKVYSVGELASPDEAVDYDELTNMLTSAVDTESWREHGGAAGSISKISAKKSLVITQTYTNHRAIAAILKQLSEK